MRPPTLLPRCAGTRAGCACADRSSRARGEIEELFAQRCPRVDAPGDLHAYRAADGHELGIGDPVVRDVALLASCDEPGAMHERQMPRHVGLGRTGGPHDRGDRLLGLADAAQDLESLRLGEQREILGHRREHAVELVRRRWLTLARRSGFPGGDGSTAHEQYEHMRIFITAQHERPSTKKAAHGARLCKCGRQLRCTKGAAMRRRYITRGRGRPRLGSFFLRRRMVVLARRRLVCQWTVALVRNRSIAPDLSRYTPSPRNSALSMSSSVSAISSSPRLA